MRRLIISASLVALSSLSGAALAQETAPVSSSAASPTTGDVSVATSGTAAGTENSVGVSGTADARAGDGGTATTSGSARINQNMAMQRSTATARDDDERARSSSRSKAGKKGADMSHSMSIYKQRGEKPVISREHEVITPKEKAAGAGTAD